MTTFKQLCGGGRDYQWNELKRQNVWLTVGDAKKGGVEGHRLLVEYEHDVEEEEEEEEEQ